MREATWQGPDSDAGAPLGRRARFVPPSPSTDQVPDEPDEDDFPPRLTGRARGARRPLPGDVPVESGPAAPPAGWSPPVPTGPTGPAGPAGPDDTRARGRRRRAVEPSTSPAPSTPSAPSAESRTRSAHAGQEVAPEPSGPDPFADFPRLPGYADLPGPDWSPAGTPDTGAPDTGTPAGWDDLADPLGAPGPDLVGQNTPDSHTPTVNWPGLGIPGETAAAYRGIDPEPTVSGLRPDLRPDLDVRTFQDPRADPPSPRQEASVAAAAGVTPDRSGIGEVAPDEPVPTPGRLARAGVEENADYPDDLRPRRGRRGADGTSVDPRADRTRRPDQAGSRPDRAADRTDADPAERTRTTKRRDRRPGQSGMPPVVGVLVGIGGSAAGAALDLVVTGGLGVLFSLCFVLTAFGVAAGIRRSDVFTAGVLPPLSALATFVGVGALAPERLGGTSSHLGAVLAGLAAESWTLVAACALALGTIGLRVALGEAPPEVSAEELLEDPSEAPGAARRSGSPRRS